MRTLSPGSLTWLSPSPGSLSLLWLVPLGGQVRTCHSLGVVYEQQGRMAEAKHHYLRAIAGRERLQGPLNPATLKVRARVPFPAVLCALHPRRPLTPHVVSVCFLSRSQAIHNYALFLQSCGELDEAEDMHVKAALGFEQTLGCLHADTMKVATPPLTSFDPAPLQPLSSPSPAPLQRLSSPSPAPLYSPDAAPCLACAPTP